MAYTCLKARLLERVLQKDHPVVLGLSGGVDSMVLFDMLIRAGYQVIAAHVNHQKRPEANDEQVWLKQYVIEQGAIFETITPQFKTTKSFQAEARHIRQAFFKRCAKDHGTHQVALAHHQDDLAETFFMRIVKGSPLLNLISMSEQHVDEGTLFARPLLSIKKVQLYAYAQKHTLTYFEDTSNVTDDYTRNRFRKTLLPWLNEENPALNDAILAHTEALAHVADLVEAHVTHFIQHQDTSAVSVKAFQDLNPLVADGVLKYLIRQTAQTRTDCSRALLKRLRSTLTVSRDNTIVPIGKSMRMHREYDHFFFATTHPPKPWSIRIDSLGRYACPNGQEYLFTDHKIAHIHSKTTEICYNCNVFPLYLRTRRPGDKMLCDFGHKKVSRLLIEKKVPPSIRDRIVLLTDAQKVLWIPFINRTCSCEQDHETDKIYVYEVGSC